MSKSMHAQYIVAIFLQHGFCANDANFYLERVASLAIKDQARIFLKYVSTKYESNFTLNQSYELIARIYGFKNFGTLKRSAGPFALGNFEISDFEKSSPALGALLIHACNSHFEYPLLPQNLPDELRCLTAKASQIQNEHNSLYMEVVLFAIILMKTHANNELSVSFAEETLMNKVNTFSLYCSFVNLFRGGYLSKIDLPGSYLEFLDDSESRSVSVEFSQAGIDYGKQHLKNSSVMDPT